MLYRGFLGADFVYEKQRPGKSRRLIGGGETYSELLIGKN
jgi:hypothetical protein